LGYKSKVEKQHTCMLEKSTMYMYSETRILPRKPHLRLFLH